MFNQATRIATAKDGERKQITAMFIDVVGFSDVASTTDAEDLLQWLDLFYSKVRQIIETHDGEITEYLGDGVVAIFGLTRADELAASKAVGAGLTVLSQIPLNLQTLQPTFLRVGIASGEVVVRADPMQGGLPRATGMVMTLARRIQEQARPGHVLIAQSTQDLLRHTIATEPMPDITLKGFAAPQTLYRALPAQPLRSIPDQAVLIGRDAEVAQIAQSRKPCLVIGQAGIGKTALVRHVALSTPDATAFMADGVQMRTIYRPFARWIGQQTGTPYTRFTEICQTFGALDETTRFAIALALGLPEGQRLLAKKSNVALKAVVESSLWKAIQSVQSGGILVFEDLHWFDNASIGVLVHILQSRQAHRYRIIITSRADPKITKYLGNTDLTQIALSPLGDQDARKLAACIADTDTTDPDLISKAGGVPLYLEQLVKSHAVAADKEIAVPWSLIDLLAERIDAAGAAKPMLQCAAVIGRSFNLDILRAIMHDPANLESHLQQAAALTLIKPDGNGYWSFTHALLQEAAYQGLLRRNLVHYHGEIAAYLKKHHSDFINRNPALITEHLSRAQQHVPAIESYLAASQWAMFQGAFEDAEAHIIAALVLCERAPAGVGIEALEIACYTALGTIRMQTQGFTAAPVRSAFEKVAALAKGQKIHSIANGPAFFGSSAHAVISGNRADAVQFSTLLREAADAMPDDEPDSAVRLASLSVDAGLHFYLGDFAQVFRICAVLDGLYDIDKHGAMVATYGMDPLVSGRMTQSIVRAICGDSHLIAALTAQTDAHQKLLNIPMMQPYTLIWGALPLFYSGDTKTAIKRTQQGIRAATRQDAAFWKMTGRTWLHLMDSTQSDTPEGCDDFGALIKAHETVGARLGLPYYRAHYARALARNGQNDAAYQMSSQAVGESGTSGFMCWHAEVLRIHARICQTVNRHDACADALKDAAIVATQQNARLWLLRARLDQVAAGLEPAEILRSALDSFDPAASLPEITKATTILASR